MTKLWGLLPAFCFLVLGGCASTGPTDGRTDAEDAAQSHLQLGIHYMRQGNLNEAKRKMEQSLQFDNSDPMAHATIALLYEQIDELGKARRHYRRALRLGDDNPAIRNNYGTFLCRQGEYREAEEELVAAASNRLYETPAAAWTNAGACVRRIPDNEAAERYFRNALRVQGNYSEALWHLADLKYEQGEYLNARAFAQRLIEQGDPPPDVLLLAIRIEDALGARSQAQNYADRLKRLYPDSPERDQLAELGYE